jgi:hypothetical protein
MQKVFLSNTRKIRNPLPSWFAKAPFCADSSEIIYSVFYNLKKFCADFHVQEFLRRKLISSKAKALQSGVLYMYNIKF